jgi:hypothetical protein
MWLRVFERVDEAEEVGNLLRRRRLHEDVGIISIVEGRKGVGRIVERFSRDDRAGEWRRRIQVLEECAAEGYYGRCCVDGYARELREVFAAMDIGPEMRRGCVGEEDEGEGRHVSGALESA